MTNAVWEEPEAVSKFAGRAPDLRMLELIEGIDEPAAVRVLDLGCAGGRNCEVLARRAFDLHALDGSRAMVTHTRSRLAPILGEQESERRVRHGRMDDLNAFPDNSFDLVVALGVFHNATHRAEWNAALAETARVLDLDGKLLVAHFTPETDLTGHGVRAVSGEPNLYDGLPSGRAFLADQETLDAEFRQVGLEPLVPTRTVRVATGSGQRVTVNALYRRYR